MKKRKIDLDVYVGIVMILIAGMIAVMAVGMPEAPRRFPILVAVVLVICAALVIVRSMRRTADNEAELHKFEWSEFKFAMALLGLIIAYAVMMQLISFFPATLIIIPLFMLFLGERKWYVIGITDVVTTAFVYWLFVMQLNIRLP